MNRNKRVWIPLTIAQAEIAERACALAKYSVGGFRYAPERRQSEDVAARIRWAIEKLENEDSIA